MTLLSAVALASADVEVSAQENWEKLARQDAMNPVAPGKVGTDKPFWNGYARRFIYVPSFEFPVFEKAKKYRFTVLDAKNKVHTFDAERPDEPLTAVWDKLPVGYTTVMVTALNGKNQIIADCGSRRFYRAAPFSGNYAPALRDYRESARWALKYVFDQKHVQAWRTTGQPSRSYNLYCYPNKLIGSVITGMLFYSKISPADREAALDIAQKAADYLISISEKADAPLAYLPPTYMWNILSAHRFAGQIMMIYPCNAGMAYMRLYEETKNEKYRTAAIRIADTYCKLQLDNGSWHLKLWQKDGSPVVEQPKPGQPVPPPNYCAAPAISAFLQMIAETTGDKKYQAAADRNLEYINNTVVKTFNWEGQFEDQIPLPPYMNNTKHTAARYAQYILAQKGCTTADVDLARTLLRYAEDQFVVWEKPMPCYPSANLHTREWMLPCVLEQYSYYVPIDASGATLIEFYMSLHQKTGNPLDLAKAKALADAATRAQDQQTGRYFTYCEKNSRNKVAGWINCAIRTSEVMIKFADYLDSLEKNKK